VVSVRVKLELCFQISARPIWRMRYSNPFNAWHKKVPFSRQNNADDFKRSASS